MVVGGEARVDIGERVGGESSECAPFLLGGIEAAGVEVPVVVEGLGPGTQRLGESTRDLGEP